MPTYEYECTECGHYFEQFQKMKEPPIEVCPQCQGKTQRLISGGTGFIKGKLGGGTYHHQARMDYADSNPLKFAKLLETERTTGKKVAIEDVD